MLTLAASWRTLAWSTMAFAAFATACSEAEEPSDAGQHREDAMVLPADLPSLQTSGGEIEPESLSCGYHQEIGSGDAAGLDIMFLSRPGHVAYGVRLDNPAPAAPFVVTPQQVERFSFEAHLETAGYGSDLKGTEITVHLDELPPTSSLNDGETVHLEGRLELTTFSMPKAWSEGDAEPTLEIAAQSIAIDCDATFRETLVLD